MGEVLKVGIAELKVAKAPVNLSSAGLGSCVGICLYDPRARIGGLAHIMLPDSNQARNSVNKAKFANTAVPVLVSEMLKLGAVKERIIAKIAGGAQMFVFPGASDFMRIGERNVDATKKALAEEKIPLAAQDTGGNYGRTIELCTTTGKLYIRTIEHGEKFI
ncbi:MAG TPA: chemotaxis protein CheD [Syntrophomonadaceae bacterium]|nr:chemotaxis protein CheD [Syntrophomonadaceae bacterium]